MGGMDMYHRLEVAKNVRLNFDFVLNFPFRLDPGFSWKPIAEKEGLFSASYALRFCVCKEVD